MELIIGVIFGGIVSWLITHLYYKKSGKDQDKIIEQQKMITTKLSDELKNVILSFNAEKLTVRELNKILESKIFEENSQGDPLPFKACPKCGSTKLERNSTVDYKRDKLFYFIKCTKCDWEEWTQ